MEIKIFSDSFRLVIIVITLCVQFSHELIEVNIDKEKHGKFFTIFKCFALILGISKKMS